MNLKTIGGQNVTLERRFVGSFQQKCLAFIPNEA